MSTRFKIYDLGFMNWIFFLILTSYFLNPTSVLAATVSLSPTAFSVQPGQVVTVNITVDPQGTAYTAKVALDFTPGILSVSSFTQASGWLPLSQPGYDSVDNSSGSLIKTAGATGGFSSSKLFGTVTFIANQSGVASISVSGVTQILNSSNQNTFTGGNQVSVSVATPAPVQQVKPINPNPPRNLMQKPVTTPTPAPATTSEPIATSTTVESQPAQASRALDIPWNYIIPALTFLIGFIVGRKTK